MRSPALITPRPRAGCHAVLAFLSKRYPPLEGRSPTCYSPVCHSTQGRSPFRVRLACVRHAASVDSEPGSNSQVKGVGPPAPHLRTSRTDTTLQRRAPVDMAHSRCSVRQVIGGSPPARAGELHPTTRTAERHPLILDGFRRSRAGCACTFYLVFKEPDFARVPHQLYFLQGNLPILQKATGPVNPLTGVASFFRERRVRCRRHRLPQTTHRSRWFRALGATGVSR